MNQQVGGNEIKTRHHYHVLCIGMDDWEKDADMMHDLFVRQLRYLAENVHVLHSPTKEEILDEIKNLPKKNLPIRPGDIFIFYYSGHGDIIDKLFYFRTKGDDKLSPGKLRDEISELKLGNVIYIIDACHAAAFSDKDDIDCNIRGEGEGKCARVGSVK